MFEIFHCSVVSLHHHGILAGCSDKELLLQKRAQKRALALELIPDFCMKMAVVSCMMYKAT